MRPCGPRFLPSLLLLLLLPAHAGGSLKDRGVPAEVVVRGHHWKVLWTDGDTLTFRSGPRKGKEARLVGYNALESYGPVHRWGSWTPEGLWEIARDAAAQAAKETWECRFEPGLDAYGRLLLDCPGVRRTLVEQGYAHVYAYDDPADPADLARQREAREKRRGIWKGGTPETLVTSVHLDAGDNVFMRVVDCRTGETRPEHQQHEVALCDEVCFGPEVSGSCLAFVPFERRYLDPPACVDP